MKNITAVLVGTSPLLQHRFGGDAGGTPVPTPETPDGKGNNGVIRIKPQDMLPRDEAALSLYMDNGLCCHPASAIQNLLVNAGGQFKMPKQRKTAKYVVPTAVRIPAIWLPILDPTTKKPNKAWEVDSRSVVIRATKGRIMRNRPRWDAWMLKVDLVVDEETLTTGFVHELLNYGGSRLGIGDYRPEKTGGFGCFRVVEFKEC